MYHKTFLALISSILLVVLPFLSLAHAQTTLLLEGPAWNHTNLTVKIAEQTGIPSSVTAEVSGAVSDWNSAISSTCSALVSPTCFSLTVVSSGPADISISVKKGANPATGVVGQTTFSSKTDGSFTHAHVSVSVALGSASFSSDLVRTIARHELGHALGLGHTTTTSSDLMSPVISAALPIPISSCDISAFNTVHAWISTGTFSPPSVTSISCS